MENVACTHAHVIAYITLMEMLIVYCYTLEVCLVV